MLTRLIAAAAFAVSVGPLAGLAVADKAPSPPKQQAAKEVTLEGEVGCGHCSFGAKVDKCNDAIRVKEGDKQVVYLFTEGSGGKHDEAMCKKIRQGKVTGSVTEKDGQKWIKVSKIDVK